MSALLAGQRTAQLGSGLKLSSNLGSATCTLNKLLKTICLDLLHAPTVVILKSKWFSIHGKLIIVPDTANKLFFQLATVTKVLVSSLIHLHPHKAYFKLCQHLTRNQVTEQGIHGLILLEILHLKISLLQTAYP